MVNLDLFHKNLVGVFFCESPCKLFALKRTGLQHYVSVTEPLDIMSEPDKSFYPSPLFYPYGLRRLVFEISYNKNALWF
jgi:hypothetical protein